MRPLLLIMALFLTVGCEEALQQSANNSTLGEELTQQEKQQIDDFTQESEKSEEEINDVGTELEAEGYTDAELTIAPPPVDYKWFQRLAYRLNLLKDHLERVYKAYFQLPERLQEFIAPWLTLHMKHTHGRLETLKNRLLIRYRTSFDYGFCVASTDIVDPIVDGVVSVDAGLHVKTDVNGVAYCEVELVPEVERPYICVLPTPSGDCKDHLCRDNIHLIKRLVNMIEDIQNNIERFIDAINE